MRKDSDSEGSEADSSSSAAVLGKLIHDIRTPLSIIANYSELLETSLESEAESGSESGAESGASPDKFALGVAKGILQSVSEIRALIKQAEEILNEQEAV